MSDKTASNSILTDRQKKFLGFVACFGGGLLLACLIAVVVVILNKALVHFGGVFWSLAISGMLAILLRPVVSLFEENENGANTINSNALFLTVLVAGTLFWMVGGKVIRQSKEFVGTAGEWPAQIEIKAKEKLPLRPGMCLSEHFQAFRGYWQELLGQKEPTSLQGLSSEQRLIIQNLTPSEQQVWSELGGTGTTGLFRD